VPILTAEDRIGSRVGPYVVDRIIGEGGMGVVFAGRDADEQPVAIKLLHPHLGADASAAKRFVREAQAAARIQHENVVRVRETVMADDGAACIVMELLDGEPLTALLLREGPLDPERTAELLLPVMDALAEAHDAGIVHRDLKPDNVFLAYRGGEVVPKLLDFGIAKLLDGSATATRTGMMLGTPAYMAPEQARGEKEIGPAADVWAMGALWFECLSQRTPYVAETPQAFIAKILTESPMRVRDVEEQVPERLAKPIDQALRKDVRERPTSMRAFASSIRLALDERRRMGLAATLQEGAGPLSGVEPDPAPPPAGPTKRGHADPADVVAPPLDPRHRAGMNPDRGPDRAGAPAMLAPARVERSGSRGPVVALTALLAIGGAAGAATMMFRGGAEEADAIAASHTGETPVGEPVVEEPGVGGEQGGAADPNREHVVAPTPAASRTDAIRAAVAAQRGFLAGCAEAGRDPGDRAEVRVVVAFEIVGEGDLSSIEVSGANEAIARCFEAAFRRMTFPAVAHPTQVSYPFVLGPSADEDAEDEEATDSRSSSRTRRAVRQRRSRPDPDDPLAGLAAFDTSPRAGSMLSRAQIARVVGRNEPALARRCRAEVSGRTRLDVRLTVTPQGRIREVRVGGDGSPALRRCVETTIRGWRFPSASEPVTFTLPIVMTPTSMSASMRAAAGD